MKVHALLIAAVCLAASHPALAVGSLAEVTIQDRQANRVLPVYQGQDGMYGMVTALIVQDAAAAISLQQAGAPAFTCVIPTQV